VINFARGLGLKYKTFKTVMLGKATYPTVNQFVNALRDFDMREDEEEVPQQNHNMVFSVQRGRGRGNYSQRRGNNNFNSRGRGFKPAGKGTYSYSSRNGPGPHNSPSNGSHERNNTDVCQICGRINHIILKCFIGEITLTKSRMNYHKHWLLLIYKILLMTPCMWTQEQVSI